jgi:hypothetical protein
VLMSSLLSIRIEARPGDVESKPFRLSSYSSYRVVGITEPGTEAE